MFIDTLAMLTILLRRIWLVLLTAVVFAGLTAGFTLMVSTIYRASMLVLIDPSVRQPFDNPNLPTRSGNESGVIDSQVALISSDTILRPVVRQFNLVKDEEFGIEGGTGLLSGWLGMISAPEQSDKPLSEVQQENKAVKNLGKALTVKREGLTFVVSISVESREPEKAAKIAEAIAHSYLADQKSQKETSSVELMEQIDKRLISLRERLQKAESAVQKFKEKNGLQSTGTSGLLINQELGDLNTQLTEARAEVAEKEARYKELSAVLKKDISPEAINDLSASQPVSQSVSQLRDQYARAVRLEANLETELLPSHPDLIRAKSQVTRIKGLLQAETERIADAARMDYAVARERVANLEKAIGSSVSKANVGDAASIHLRELETEAKTTRTLSQNILGCAKEIAELEQVVVPGARIIASARAPEHPVWPRKKLMVALAGILGLLVGTGGVVGGEAVRQVSASLKRDHARAEMTASRNRDAGGLARSDSGGRAFRQLRNAHGIEQHSAPQAPAGSRPQGRRRHP
ncbi:GumC family protein [Breoghania sp.]|uniref:GumC family protein n=1 Tax=Breoghania sp. TaxID=2065378 RepID=UPI0026186861|nr:GumC family protein [Breoghania sp.]MDJ0930990.1 GumC family protein [Breoghania sp.]